MEIKTREDWWEGYKTLLPLLKEWLYDVPCDNIVKNLEAAGRGKGKLAQFWRDQGPCRAHDVMEAMLTNKDHENAHRVLHSIWDDLPDRKETRSLPGFFLLCDLCSEYWVFQEDEE